MEEEQDSIGVGCSAMSGRSSTARRRMEKILKLKNIAKMHIPDYNRIGNEDTVELLSEHAVSLTNSLYDHEAERQQLPAVRSEAPNSGEEKMAREDESNEVETEDVEQKEDETDETDDDAIDPKVIATFKKRLEEEDKHVFL